MIIQTLNLSNILRPRRLPAAADAASVEQTEGSSAPPRFPTFGVSGELYAIGARRAGRINAASVSKEEFNKLLQERQVLLDKKFAGTMTRKESIRLEYVRWSLDRIEDARHGQTLDALDDLVTRYEQLQTDLRNFEQDLSQHKTGHRY